MEDFKEGFNIKEFLTNFSIQEMALAFAKVTYSMKAKYLPKEALSFVTMLQEYDDLFCEGILGINNNEDIKLLTVTKDFMDDYIKFIDSRNDYYVYYLLTCLLKELG